MHVRRQRKELHDFFWTLEKQGDPSGDNVHRRRADAIASSTCLSEFNINFARGVLENDISAMGKSHLAFALFSQPRAGKCGKGSRRRAPGPKTQVEERFFSSIGARGSDTTPPAPCVTSSHATSQIAKARWKRVHFFSMIGFSTLYERADTFFRSR